MRLEYFCHLMHWGVHEEGHLGPHWQLAQSTLPDNIEFLSSEFVEEYYPLLTWGDDVLKERLLETVRQIKSSPGLRLYAWLLHDAFFRRMEPGELCFMPPPVYALGDNAGLLHLLVALSAFPLIRQTLERLKIPQDKLNEVAKWVRGTIGIYAAAHKGLPGHDLSQTSWIALYIKGELFRVGRFEFLIHTIPGWLPPIYRNRQDKRVVALCQDGWKLDAEGLRAVPGTDVFTATLEYRDAKVFGTPISPNGRALIKRKIELAEDQWEAVVSPWEWVPSVHIPGGGGMKPELALESLREAKAFFKRNFQRDIKVFCCGSWILNPDWEQELPESNLTHFMRLLYCVPGPVPQGTEGQFFVFGRSTQDWSILQEDNSLRRAFHRLHRSGRVLRSGVGFVLTDDLDSLEENFYRNHVVLPE